MYKVRYNIILKNFTFYAPSEPDNRPRVCGADRISLILLLFLAESVPNPAMLRYNQASQPPHSQREGGGGRSSLQPIIPLRFKARESLSFLHLA